jgi:hypothetical protein
MARGPPGELLIPLACRGNGDAIEPRPKAVDRDGDVNVLVGIEADDDGLGNDILHTGPPGRWKPKAMCERTGL